MKLHIQYSTNTVVTANQQSPSHGLLIGVRRKVHGEETCMCHWQVVCSIELNFCDLERTFPIRRCGKSGSTPYESKEFGSFVVCQHVSKNLPETRNLGIVLLVTLIHSMSFQQVRIDIWTTCNTNL